MQANPAYLPIEMMNLNPFSSQHVIVAIDRMIQTEIYVFSVAECSQ